MKLLITGANGFIGKSLCELLLAENNHIVAPVRSIELLKPHDFLCPITITGLQDNIDWLPMLDDVEVVVHLASRVHVMDDDSKDPISEFRKINVDATLDLARQAASAGVKRFIYLSSIKVNGEATFPNQPFTSEDTPLPVDPYGVSKYEAETGLFKLANKTGMEVVIIRPPLVYGPGVKANFLSMLQWLDKGVPLPLGNINNNRSLVALDNLIDLIITCIDHPAAANQIFLVSDGEDLSTTELIQKVARALGQRERLVPVPAKLLRIAAVLLGKRNMAERLLGSLQVDISKTRELLNWKPPLNVDRALEQTARAFHQNK